MKTMVVVYEREERKQLALAFLSELEGRVSKLHAQIVTNEANSGYEFDAIESALTFANTYGFEISQGLVRQALDLFHAEGCETATLEAILGDRPSARG